MRVAFLASECEPWAKTGGLADVVDALARALGTVAGDSDRGAGRRLPAALSQRRRAGCRSIVPIVVQVPDPRAPSGHSEITILDVPANGYRLRLVDHPAAFDREGFYGDAAGDFADNAWRFGLFCRAALEALRADGRPIDVLHLHDWHTGPAAIFRDARYAGRPGRRARRDPDDRAQPCLSRLDPPRAPRPARACRRATASSVRKRTGSTCWPPGSSGPSWSTRCRPGSPPRR